MFPCARLPFPVCWFEWRAAVQNPAQTKIRIGLIVEEITLPEGARSAEWPERDDVAFALVIRMVTQDNSDLGKCSPIVFCAATLALDANGRPMLGSGNGDYALRFPFGVDADGPNREPMLQGAALGVTMLCAALSLLHCKNVGTREVAASPELQKSRLRGDKLPFVRYSVIEVSGDGNDGHTVVGGINSAMGRHICRGHFKRFTSDAPLFGKVTGLYWWHPHLRGDAKRGVILSEYQIGPRPHHGVDISG